MKKRILIVDDEEQILKLFSRMLEKENHEIHTALSGREALNLMKTITFDLILLDLNMPEMNGTETLRGIREIDQHVPVYLVSAFHNEFHDILKEMKSEGISFEILNKPIEKKQLVLAVESELLAVESELLAVESELKGPLADDHMDIIRLYIYGQSAKLNEDVETLQNLLNKKSLFRYQLEIIDVLENPTAAYDDHVFVTPTLIWISSKESKRIIGNISDAKKLAVYFGIM